MKSIVRPLEFSKVLTKDLTVTPRL
jgi:hypothetical protein